MDLFKRINSPSKEVKKSPIAPNMKKRKSDELLQSVENTDPNKRVHYNQVVSVKNVLKDFDIEGSPLRLLSIFDIFELNSQK
jgi:hypothetical protein